MGAIGVGAPAAVRWSYRRRDVLLALAWSPVLCLAVMFAAGFSHFQGVPGVPGRVLGVAFLGSVYGLGLSPVVMVLALIGLAWNRRRNERMAEWLLEEPDGVARFASRDRIGAFRVRRDRSGALVLQRVAIAAPYRWVANSAIAASVAFLVAGGQWNGPWVWGVVFLGASVAALLGIMLLVNAWERMRFTPATDGWTVERESGVGPPGMWVRSRSRRDIAGEVELVFYETGEAAIEIAGNGGAARVGVATLEGLSPGEMGWWETLRLARAILERAPVSARFAAIETAQPEEAAG